MTPGRHGERSGVRIIAGSLRGRTIQVPPGLKVRPMRTRIRGALFNVLGEELNGARFLDIFAGSGSIAIEALSRGAREAVLIENDPEVIEFLERNLEEHRLGRRARILSIDPYDTLPSDEKPFRHVFLDPPFADYRGGDGGPWGIARRLIEAGLVESRGTIGLEYPADLNPPEPPPGLELARDRRYGDTAMVLWRVQE